MVWTLLFFTGVLRSVAPPTPKPATLNNWEVVMSILEILGLIFLLILGNTAWDWVWEQMKI
jgi:hypothetical protein